MASHDRRGSHPSRASSPPKTSVPTAELEHAELMAKGEHLGAELRIGAGADEDEVSNEADELVGETEAEKRLKSARAHLAAGEDYTAPTSCLGELPGRLRSPIRLPAVQKRDDVDCGSTYANRSM